MVPSASNAHDVDSPTEIAVALVIPLTCAGVVLPPVVPFPSQPPPQQLTRPRDSSAHVGKPTATALAAVMPRTAIGVLLHWT